MNTLARRARFTDAPWIAGIAALCAAVGVTSGISPKYGFAAVLGLIFTGVVLANLTAGLALFTVLSFLDVLNVGGAAVSFMKVAGLLIFLSWVARASTESRVQARALLADHPVLVAGMVGLVAWSAISVAWAESPSVALTTTYSYALDAMLVPIAFSAIRERRHAHLVVGGFVLGAVLSGAYGIVHPISAYSAPNGQVGRLVGGIGDANEQASVLVAGIALCIGLAGPIRRSAPLKLAVAAAAVIAFFALLATESRGGLVSFACVLVAGVLFGGRWRGKAALLVAVAALCTGGYFLAIASASSLQRVTSADTSGRVDLWTVAWRMFSAHPVTGGGAGNFKVSSIHYLNQPGEITAAAYIVDTPKVVHNTYLEQLADLGVPGLVVVLVVFVAAFAAALRAAHIFERLGDRDLELLSRCVILALVAFLSSDIFLTNLVSKQLWIVIALCPAILAIARSHEHKLARGETVT